MTQDEVRRREARVDALRDEIDELGKRITPLLYEYSESHTPADDQRFRDRYQPLAFKRQNLQDDLLLAKQALAWAEGYAAAHAAENPYDL